MLVLGITSVVNSLSLYPYFFLYDNIGHIENFLKELFKFKQKEYTSAMVWKIHNIQFKYSCT